MKINSDNILIRNLAGGDITAMDVLYIRYAPQVKAFLGKAVLDAPVKTKALRLVVDSVWGEMDTPSSKAHIFAFDVL